MADFLSEQDCQPNMNSATIAGKVIKREEFKGKVVGLSFVISYKKTWPSGVQEIPIKCFVSGQDRIDKLQWLKKDEVILVKGEVTERGVYAWQIQQLSKASREPGEDDEYLTRAMQHTNRG
jgi:hypothetical protein